MGHHFRVLSTWKACVVLDVAWVLNPKQKLSIQMENSTTQNVLYVPNASVHSQMEFSMNLKAESTVNMTFMYFLLPVVPNAVNSLSVELSKRHQQANICAKNAGPLLMVSH